MSKASGSASPQIEAKAEEDLSSEERLEWLRARGVLVEEPTSRRQTGTKSTGGPCFKYVKIPHDENHACEELSGEVGTGDALPSILSPAFAGGANLSDDELLAHASAMGQNVGLEALRKVMSLGGAEAFRLAVPTDANGREGVYAYLDEASAVKGLPTNKRATALARSAGFPATCLLCGDIYIGRQKWNAEGLVENIDFAIPELEPTSLWIRRAPTENLEFQKATQPDAHGEAQQGAFPADLCSGETEHYSWKDQGEEIEILVKIEKGTAKRDVKVEFKRKEIVISKPLKLSLKLFKTVETDGCNWTLGDGQLVLTLEKSDGDKDALWPRLLDAI